MIINVISLVEIAKQKHTTWWLILLRIRGLYPNYKCINLTYPTYNWGDVTHLLTGMSQQGQYLPQKQMGLSDTWATKKKQKIIWVSL